MIHGVEVKELMSIPDERGRLMEVMRCDEKFFNKFGQVYITTAYPGVVKGWHYHKQQEDNMTVIKGMMKIVLYDGRKNSPTFGQVNEFFLGVHSPYLVKIPALVLHGFKCISEEESIVINVTSEPYNRKSPDEFRVHPHKNQIPYDWNRKDG
ncbi:dTDP-4-dehydrorhamnose 3,5-epimerase [Candidatus Woesearchaeota archaeon]|nr:dTDP-4-dehydrorhamnose 3,5-epimerase [Candidatus Woesearchaeota archaeon]